MTTAAPYLVKRCSLCRLMTREELRWNNTYHARRWPPEERIRIRYVSFLVSQRWEASSIRTGLAVRARCFHAREIEPAVRLDPQRARWIAAKTDVPSAGLSF
jgi:hypothetical protein